MVGIAQLVRAPDCGSGGRGFKSHYPPQNYGLSPSGKAPDFDSGIRWFKSSQPSQKATLGGLFFVPGLPSLVTYYRIVVGTFSPYITSSYINGRDGMSRRG